MKEIKAIEFKKEYCGKDSYFDIEIYKDTKEILLREWINWDDNSSIILSYEEFDKLVELVNEEREK